jgi:hypothetical protein
VLDLREDECGFHDVAYLGRADGDVLEGAPAFLQEGEAAFALVAEAAEEHAAAFGVGVEVAFGWLSHRDEHSGAGASYPESSRQGKAFSQGRRAGRTSSRAAVMSWVLPGPGLRCPQGDAVRGDDALDEAGVLVRLPGNAIC